MVHNKIKAGLHDGIPIAAGYFSVSFTFGMMAVQDGISPFHAVLISLLNLTSAGMRSCLFLYHKNWINL